MSGPVNKEIFAMGKYLVGGVAAAFLLAGGPAEAGCLKGAAAGAVIGHFAHHHAVLGAIAGCAIAHHMDKKERERHAAEQAAQQHPQQNAHW
jgi:hypothetical protein